MAALRPLTSADLDAVLEIQNASPGAAQWTAEAWQAFCGPQESAADGKLRAGYFASVAFEECGVRGFLAGMFSGEELEILNLAVAPLAKRRGIAAALVAGALDGARNAGARRTFLEVRASNAEAIAFYEQQGFLPAGLRNNYYRGPLENALVLARKLS